MDSFTSDDKWLDIFGERLILQKPEDMELFPAVEKGFSYLMLFTDDVKIDLTLLPLELIDEYFTWDKLVKLLLDKDNRIVKPPIPLHGAHTAFSCYPALRLYRLSKSQRGIGVVSLSK